MRLHDLNEEVAFAIGWKLCREKYFNHYRRNLHWKRGDEVRAELPRFDLDLNAMHEAEKTLTAEEWERYERVVFWMVNKIMLDLSVDAILMHTRCRIRFDALLTIKGKLPYDEEEIGLLKKDPHFAYLRAGFVNPDKADWQNWNLGHRLSTKFVVAK